MIRGPRKGSSRIRSAISCRNCCCLMLANERGLAVQGRTILGSSYGSMTGAGREVKWEISNAAM